MIVKALKKLESTVVKRAFSEGKNFKVTLFPGDGIGPEISQAVIDIFTAAKVPIEWEFHQIHSRAVTAAGDLIGPESIESIKRNTYALKGPFETPIGKGHRSLNVTLRKKLNLYANLRPCLSIKGIKTVYENVNVVTIRENTEGEYSGLEHEVVPGVVENLKIISEKACRKVAEFAFDFAIKNNRKTVVACHKAGISAMADGLFIRICREVSEKYPSIQYKEEQVDTVSMGLAQYPEKFDVMVMPNLYGDIISDLCAGLIGGLGLTASGNIGEGVAVYEAVHGSAPDIAGKNLANPTALLLSGVMMLEKMGLNEQGSQIKNACLKVYEEGKYITGDVGGKASTTEFTKAVIGNL
jgi:isocitrate dehydrogenase (NAD+)